MKTVCYALLIVSSLICAGCGSNEQDNKPKSEAAYRELLKKRISSGGGAVININLEVNKYRNASPDEKRKMYRSVEELVH